MKKKNIQKIQKKRKIRELKKEKKLNAPAVILFMQVFFLFQRVLTKLLIFLYFFVKNYFTCLKNYNTFMSFAYIILKYTFSSHKCCWLFDAVLVLDIIILVYIIQFFL